MENIKRHKYSGCSAQRVGPEDVPAKPAVYDGSFIAIFRCPLARPPVARPPVARQPAWERGLHGRGEGAVECFGGAGVGLFRQGAPGTTLCLWRL